MLMSIVLALSSFGQTNSFNRKPDPDGLVIAKRIVHKDYQTNAIWPKFHGDNRNTSQSPYGGSNGQIRWQVQTGFFVSSSPAIGADGTVYIGSDDNHLYAIYPDGNLRYKATFPQWVYSSPAISSDGYVYVGCEDGWLYAVDSLGNVNQVVKSHGQILSSPAIDSSGRIFFGSEDSYVHCVYGGNWQWSYQTGGEVDASPAIGPDGTVYIGSMDGYLYALSPTNGHLNWRFQTGYLILGAAAVGADGTIYVGSYDGYFYAINPDGSQKWRYFVGNLIFAAPSIAPDGTIYIGAYDNRMYAFRPDGTVKWTFLTGGTINSAPAIGADGTIYFGSCDSNLYALDSNGNLLWQFPTGYNIYSNPAIGPDGTVYFGSWDCCIYALGTSVNTIPVAGVAVNPTSVPGGTSAVGTVTISSPAPKGGDLVMLSATDTNASVPPFVTVPAGATQVTFNVTTKAVSSSDIVVITAKSGSASANTGLTVQPAFVSALGLFPTIIGGGGTSTGTVTLSGPAGPSGNVVTLTSSNTAVATVPSTVTVAAGKTSATFTVTGLDGPGSQTSTITATGGGQTATATITVNPETLLSVSASQLSIVGGDFPTGKVTLSAPAPAGGDIILLSSNDPCVTVPATITIAGGSTSTTFTVVTAGVDTNHAVTIAAQFGSAIKSCGLFVTPASVMSMTINPSSVVGGSMAVVTGTINLNGKAGPSGTVVNLASSDPNVVIVASSVTVAPASAHATIGFWVNSVNVSETVTVIASNPGGSAQANLTVNPGVITSVASSQPSIVGGDYPNLTVAISVPAPGGGAVISLGSNNPAIQPPATVTIPAYSKFITVPLPTLGVDATTSGTITATYGLSTKTCNQSLVPAVVMAVNVTPNAVVGGISAVTGKVDLNGKAGPSGIIVTLTSSLPGAASVPATITIPAGAAHGTFAVTTFTVGAAQSVTVTASSQGGSATTTLTVNPDGLIGFTVAPSSIVGGDFPTGTVTLSAAAPLGGTVVSLASSSTSIVPPATVTIPAGSASANFLVPTLGVDGITPVTLTATLGTISINFSEALVPAWVLSVTTVPSTVKGGANVTGTIVLNGKSGPSGTVVSLTSSNAGVASVPATVTVPALSSHVSFTITTSTVVVSQAVTITATNQGKSSTSTLTVTP